MKKKILTMALSSVIVIFSIVFIIGINRIAPGNNYKKLNEEVSLVLFKSYDYSQSLYDACSAAVHVAIDKVNNNGDETSVWEKTFDSKYLAQYPSATEAIKENISINTVAKKNEYLVVRYNILYNTKGNKLEIPNAVIVNNTSSKSISISI